MNLERIVWQDPVGFSEWQTPEDVAELKPAQCVTVAYVIREDDNVIVTAASHSWVGQDITYADVTILPKGCVITRQLVDIQEKGHTNGVGNSRKHNHKPS